MASKKKEQPPQCGVGTQGFDVHSGFIPNGSRELIGPGSRVPTGEPKANDRQVAGTHYKNHKIEPWDITALNGLDVFQHEICTYVMRYKDKGGVADLEKAKHWLEKYIEVVNAGYGTPEGLDPSYVLGQLRK